jgi:predicted enzyme related to lactoylglutathione lyase
MSLNINPVNWFEIPTADLERAINFYQQIFGIEISINEMGNLKMGWFPFEEDGTGTSGTLIEAESYEPSYKGSMVYFSVDDIEDTLQKVKSSGGKVITEKMSIGEFGFVGHFEDSEGNRLGLHSNS